MKIVKRIVLGLLILLFLIATAVFIVLRFYEDDVARFAMGKVKKEMATAFEVDNIELVFWRTFPSTSLHLENVYIQESLPEGDTLLYAQSLFLKLNFWDLFAGNYRVKEVELKTAELHLKVNAEGTDNWHFWKAGASTDSTQFEIKLEEVQLTDTRVTYADAPSDFDLDLFSVNSSGSGDFSERSFDVVLDADARIARIVSDDDTYLEKQTVIGEVAMHADLDKNTYTFQPSDLTCGDLALQIQGSVNTSEGGVIEIFVEADDQEMADALGVLPGSVRKTVERFKPSGDFSAKAKVSRKDPKAPVMVEVELQATDASIRAKEEGVALRDIQTDLYFVRGGKKDQVRLKSFSCALDDSRLTAKGSIIGFDNPALNLDVSAQLQLRDIKDFLDLQHIEICEGDVRAEAGVKGTLKYVPADSTYNWREIIASGSADLTEGRLKMKDSNRMFEQLTARVAFDKQNALINEFSGVVNGGDFKLKGELVNLVPFMFEPQARVLLDASLESNVIDFTNLVEEDGSTANDSEYEFGLPARVDFRLNTNIGKFIFRKFEATQVRGLAMLDQGRLTIDPLSFSTADGRLSAQLVMAPAGEGNYRMNCLADVTSINIRKVFTEFENFGQDYVQDRHLNGLANAKVQFRAVVTKSLEIPSDKIESLIDVSIENGELIGFESLQEIAEYIRSNKWVAPFVDEDKFAERMKSIKFSKLENVIEIRNRMITIPLMDIKSSAMDISAKGTHTFDNAINYAIGFNMRDLLIRREREMTEVDDGLGKSMFIAMTGTVDNPSFNVDKELAKEVRQEAMQQEKQNMKSLLKEEFGLFKKDEGVGPYQEKKSTQGDANISIDWEEENGIKSDEVKSQQKPADTKKQDVPPTDTKKKKTPKWLEEKDQ